MSTILIFFLYLSVAPFHDSLYYIIFLKAFLVLTNVLYQNYKNLGLGVY